MVKKQQLTIHTLVTSDKEPLKKSFTSLLKWYNLGRLLQEQLYPGNDFGNNRDYLVLLSRQFGYVYKRCAMRTLLQK